MSKFKVGDTVITEWFDEKIRRNPSWGYNVMDEFIGECGEITAVMGGPINTWYEVHGFYWPEDALAKEDRQITHDRRLEEFTKAALTGLCALPNAWCEKTLDDYGPMAVTIAKHAVEAFENEVSQKRS